MTNTEYTDELAFLRDLCDLLKQQRAWVSSEREKLDREVWISNMVRLNIALKDIHSHRAKLAYWQHRGSREGRPKPML